MKIHFQPMRNKVTLQARQRISRAALMFLTPLCLLLTICMSTAQGGLPDFEVIDMASPAVGESFRAYVTVINWGTVTGTVGWCDVMCNQLSSVNCTPWNDGSLSMGTLAVGESKTWNRALTPDEVATLYAAGSNGMFKELKFFAQPQNAVAYMGVSHAPLNVFASGTGTLGYQWQRNGANLPGQTGTALALSNPQLTDAGNYTVVVTDATGLSITSQVTALTVKPCEEAGQDALVGWWSGDGHSLDLTTNHVDGTLQSGASYTLGLVGQAFSLDGVDDFVQVPDSPLWAFGTSDFSIALWANFAATDGGRTFLACDDCGGPCNKWVFWLDNGQIIFHLNGSAIANIGMVPFSPVLGEWYHLAVTRQGSTYTFYIDGQLVSTRIDSQAVPDASVPLTIGQADGTFNFSGLLDEIMVCSRALSYDEIAVLYAASAAGKCKTLQILAQPQNAVAYVGGGSTNLMSVTVSGTGALIYQWQRNGINLPGQAGTALALSSPQLSDAGNYTVVVTDATGLSITSQVATLNVKLCDIVPGPYVVSWWPADSNANDVIGTNNGALEGGAGFGVGVCEQAFEFHGGIDSVVVPDSPTLEFVDRFTIEAWINPVTNTGAIVSKQMFRNNGYRLVLNDRYLVGGLGSYLWDPSSQIWRYIYHSISSSMRVPLGVWSHVAWTYDQSTMMLYINGTPAATNVIGPVIIAGSSANLRIGYRDNGQMPPFNGWIDEVVIYRRALTPEEIQRQNNLNLSPQLPAQPDVTIAEGTLLTVTNTATDSGELFKQFIYQLITAPQGAGIDANGVITWMPTEAQSPSTNPFVTVVRDNASPPLYVTNRFLVMVVDTPIHYVNEHNSTPVAPYFSWETAATNIQDAVDAASVEDTVLVTNGIYARGGCVVYGANRVAITNPMTVRSVNGPKETIIQGQGPMGGTTVRCVYVSDGATLVGFTLTNGFTQTDGGGGGIYCDFQAGIVSNCILTGNSAGNGGGACNGTLFNCTLTGNSAELDGGGTYNSRLYNCTLIGNSAQVMGGGSYGSTLYNCIVYYNNASDKSDYDNSSTLDYCCTLPMPTSGAGNITNEPSFANRLAGDYHLAANSPCIDAGTNQAWMVGATDLDGRPRIIGERVDMGAYERAHSLIPADWLTRYGLALDGSSDFQDNDADGMKNWQEWRCNTDPTNEISFLGLTQPFTTSVPEGTGLVVRWRSAADVQYRLNRSTNLSTDGFGYLVRTNIPATPPMNSETDTTAVGTGPWFYRVGVE